MAAEGKASRPFLRWGLLLLFSAVAAGLLELIGLPAALLVGPMSAAILLSTRQIGLTVPRPMFLAAQAMVGCLIASSMTRETFVTIAGDWPLFLGVTAATLAASSLLGYFLSRWQVLPGTAAIWGSAPGAATAMVLMAEAYGADARLVAVMTYTRVVCVAIVAALLALVLTGHGHRHVLGWELGVDPRALAETLGIAVVGASIALRFRVPGGALLGPIVLGTILNVSGLVRFDLPIWLLAPCYAVVGWRIGLSFTPDALHVAARALPRILLSIALLIGFCAALGQFLAWLTGRDAVTAFLGTSPGGMDSIAIIAASTPVDIPFVMALQAMRFVAVLLVGPSLARFVAGRRLARGTPGDAFEPGQSPLEEPHD